MSKKVTIYDVATEAGVSLATVSRVINGSSVVKKQTRDKVLETIQRLDFKQQLLLLFFLNHYLLM